MVCALLLVLIGTGQHTSAQGIERESLAGEDAADAIKASNADAPYNLRIGPVTVRMDAGVTTSYNDNINVAHTHALSDIIITPTLGIHGLWQATDLNSLSFDLGLGYQLYTMHSGNSSLNISPSSQTQFNLYAGDFRINLHDRFSFSQNPLAVGQLSNVSDFPVLDNTAGVNVDWDLSDLILSLGYDHLNQWVLDNEFSYLTYESDSVIPRITFKIGKSIDTGLSAEFSTTSYDQHVQNGSDSVKVGPFVNAQVTENLSVDAQAGWDYSDYNKGGSNGDTSNLSGFYGNAGLSHRISDVITESVTGGQEYIPGVNSNYTKRAFANYDLGWQATHELSLGSNFWWENLEDSASLASQDANRYGVGLNLDYGLTDHTDLGFGYQYVLKDAKPVVDGYSQNLATFRFLYHF